MEKPAGAVKAEIDLNADLGEGFDDAAILPFLSSCSIACGGHAGDSRTMAATLSAARPFGVSCGAHPGYPDRAGFGRRELPMTLGEISASVLDQVEALVVVARKAAMTIGHVKPHGALYHACNRRRDTARAVSEAISRRHPSLAVVGMAGSILLEEAERAGLRSVPEAFADRLYLEDGTLAPRGTAGAVHASPEKAAAQALEIVRERRVTTASGVPLAVDARTICLHGDTPGAVEIARAIRARLESQSVEIKSFLGRGVHG